VDGVAVAVAALEYLARNKMLDTERINWSCGTAFLPMMANRFYRMQMVW
jgi:hypothetical protein